MAAVSEWRAGCLGLSRQEKEASGSLTSSLHKVTGTQQNEAPCLSSYPQDVSL